MDSIERKIAGRKDRIKDNDLDAALAQPALNRRDVSLALLSRAEKSEIVAAWL